MNRGVFGRPLMRGGELIDPIYRDAALRSLEDMEKEAVRFEERAERKLKLVSAGVYDEEFVKLEVAIWRTQAKQIREQAEILRKKIYE
jgi:hypothetical protein